MIELAEAQSSKVRLKAVAQDPRTLLMKIVREHEQRARAAGLTLKVWATADLAEMPLDTKFVSRILGILLDNALRFTPAGGTITVAARVVPRSAIHAPLAREVEEYLELSVEDTGVGISPEVMARLFRPFIQGDGRLARTHQGTGIGLTLAKQFARLHGGGCAVESEPGAGAKFFVYLPTRETRAHHVSPHPVPHAPHKRGNTW